MFPNEHLVTIWSSTGYMCLFIFLIFFIIIVPDIKFLLWKFTRLLIVSLNARIYDGKVSKTPRQFISTSIMPDLHGGHYRGVHVCSQILMRLTVRAVWNV